MSLVASLTPGMAVVDVGANLGSMTSQYLQSGAEVWAVEPDPRCWRDLSQFVDAAHLIGVALGDTEGVGLLYRSRQAAHNSLAEANVIEPGTIAALHVPVSTLDALQAHGRIPPHIDAIKVDAQGAEVSILRGGRRMLETQRPLLYLEVWRSGLEAAGESVQTLRDVLVPLGYAPARSEQVLMLTSETGQTACVRHHVNPQTWANTIALAQAQQGHGSIDVLFAPSERIKDDA